MEAASCEVQEAAVRAVASVHGFFPDRSDVLLCSLVQAAVADCLVAKGCNSDGGDGAKRLAL